MSTTKKQNLKNKLPYNLQFWFCIREGRMLEDPLQILVSVFAFFLSLKVKKM